MCCGKLKKSGEPKAGVYPSDNEYALRGLMWADNCWLFSDNRERLISTVNDIIEELMDLTWSPSRNHCGGQVHTNTRT